jgi:hypothetical protein
MNFSGADAAAGNHKENAMDNLNTHGLFDEPVQRTGSERRSFTLEEMQCQFDQGAFDMDVDEAIKAGLLNPYDDDAVLVTVIEEAS